MPYDPDKHKRRSIRLKDYDYSQPGGYFVTICTDQRELSLGTIHDSEVILSAYGHIAAGCWQWLAAQYPYVQVNDWVVMPNHLHGILTITDTYPPTPKRKTLGSLIGVFKTVSTQFINRLRGLEAVSFWQRNYYEHIIRNEDEWRRICEYIINNPMRWIEDDDNPMNWGRVDD